MNEPLMRKYANESLQVYAANFTNSRPPQSHAWAAFVERYVTVLNQSWREPMGDEPKNCMVSSCGQYVIYDNGAINRIKWDESLSDLKQRIRETY